MKKINIIYKIKASTLIETVVAMTIMLIFILLSMLILTNINKNNNKIKIRAHIVTDYFLEYTKNESRFFDEEFNDAGMRIEKTIELKNENAIIVNVKAYNADTILILEKKEIVKQDEEISNYISEEKD